MMKIYPNSGLVSCASICRKNASRVREAAKHRGNIRETAEHVDVILELGRPSGVGGLIPAQTYMYRFLPTPYPRPPSHFRVSCHEKGTSENKVPGFVGAFKQTHKNARLVVRLCGCAIPTYGCSLSTSNTGLRASDEDQRNTHTHLRSPEKLVRTYVLREVASNRN